MRIPKSFPRRAAALLVALLALMLAGCGGGGTGGGGDSSAVYGTGEYDPENTEPGDTGAALSAENIPAMEGRTHGIDVSKWQGVIDWEKVAASGCDYAFVRVGYRSGEGEICKDSSADYNLQRAGAAGVRLGVYFFSTAISVAEAKEEASFVLRNIACYPVSYPVVYDCEGFASPDSRMSGVSAKTRSAAALAFLDAVAKAGYDTMLYGNAAELENGAFWDLGKIAERHKIWVAQYPDTAYPQKETPDYGGEFSAWQYTNRGSVPGVEGDVDLSVCYFKKNKASPKDPSASPPAASAPSAASGDSYTPVSETVTAKDEVNLREGASTKSRVVGVLKNGETARRTGVGANGWSRLSRNGETVYAITSYLTTDLGYKPPAPADVVEGNTFTPVDDRVTAKEEVNLRALPYSGSEVVGTLRAGEFLRRVAVSDKGWSRLEWNGRVVYAVTRLLTDTAASSSPSPSTGETFRDVDERVTAKDETNLRDAPTTDGSNVLYTLKKGEYVRRTGVGDRGWSRLEWNGRVVYAVTSYLTTE